MSTAVWRDGSRSRGKESSRRRSRSKAGRQLAAELPPPRQARRPGLERAPAPRQPGLARPRTPHPSPTPLPTPSLPPPPPPPPPPSSPPPLPLLLLSPPLLPPPPPPPLSSLPSPPLSSPSRPRPLPERSGQPRVIRAPSARRRSSMPSYPRSTCRALRMTDVPRRQRGRDERHAGPDVGRADRRGVEPVRADHDRAVRIAENDARAHRDQPVHEEEPALEELLVDEHRPGALRREHERERREVGRETGPRRVVDFRNRAVDVAHVELLLRRHDQRRSLDRRLEPEPRERERIIRRWSGTIVGRAARRRSSPRSRRTSRSRCGPGRGDARRDGAPRRLRR